jgi:hypothetical protein
VRKTAESLAAPAPDWGNLRDEDPDDGSLTKGMRTHNDGLKKAGSLVCARHLEDEAGVVEHGINAGKLNQLAHEIFALATTINRAHFPGGFLHDALTELSGAAVVTEMKRE